MSGRGKIIIGGCLFTLMFAFWSIATGRSIGDLRSSSDCGVETVFQDGATIVVAVTNPGAASLQKGDEIRLISNFPERSPREFFQGPVNLPSGENLTLVIRRNDTLSSAVITTAPIPFKGWMTMAGALIGPWTFLIIGLLILLLRQADEQAWLLAMMLGTFSGLFGTGLQDGDMVVLVFSGLARAAGFVFTPIFLNFFLLFPARSSVLDRFKSLERWIYFPFLYILIPVFVVARIGPLNEHLFSRIPEGFFKAFNVFILALSLAYIVAGLTALVISYRVSSIESRRKLHLLVAGCSLGTVNLLAVIIIELVDRAQTWKAAYSFLQFLTSITLPLIPISFAYAIIKHQVIPVSLMVRRGMRYLLVSRGAVLVEILLISALFGFVLDQFFQELFGYFHPETVQMLAAIVGVISAITAILFWNLARYLHKRYLAPVIDRRFFRQTYDAHQMMMGLAESLRTATDREGLLREVATKLQAAMATENVSIFLKDAATGNFVSRFGVHYSLADRIVQETNSELVIPGGSGVATMLQVMRKCLEVDTLPLNGAEKGLLDSISAVLLLPLSVGENLLGFVSLGPRLADLPYSGEDEQILMSIADPVALALQNSHLIEQMIREARRRQELEAENEARARELEEARQLQLSMLPSRLPAIAGLDIAVHMQTATEVGGDYYDFLDTGDGPLTVAIGDATGHGLKAGTIVTATKGLFCSLAEEQDLTTVLTRISAALKQMNLRGLFMGLTLLRLDQRRLTITSAGMPPVLIYRAKQSLVETVSLPAPPLGSLRSIKYATVSLRLEPGDVLLMMSDGFPERFNPQGEILGYETAASLLPALAEKSAAGIIDELVRKSDEWGAGRPLDDDLTFVVIKIADGDVLGVST